MNNLISDLAGDNSLFGLSYELAADNIPLLVVALAVDILLFLVWRKLINPAVVLFILSVVGIILDLIERFGGNKTISIYLPEWFIFLIGQLSYSTLVGFFIWIVFSYYYEKKRKDIYVKRLSVAYDSFKESVMRIFLSATEEIYDSNLEKELLDYKNFNNYFKGGDRKRMYSVFNQLSNEKYSYRHDLLIQFELLQREISNVLNSNISHSEESYNHLCVMSECIARRKLDYDNIISSKNFDFYDFDKSFMREIFSILSQWSLISGQLKEDPIKKTFQEI